MHKILSRKFGSSSNDGMEVEFR